MTKPGPSLFARYKGYARLQAISSLEDLAENPNWTRVAGFPEYEVSELRQVRSTGSHRHIQPYEYPQRPYDGLFVDLWVDGRNHIMALDTIMMAAFPKGDA